MIPDCKSDEDLKIIFCLEEQTSELVDCTLNTWLSPDVNMVIKLLTLKCGLLELNFSRIVKPE